MGRQRRIITERSRLLGEYLRSLRKQRNLSQRQVECQVGVKVSNSYLSQLENGQVQYPHPQILMKLAKAYLVPYPELLLRVYGHGIKSEEEIPETFSVAGLTREEYLAASAYLILLRRESKNDP